MQHLAFVIDDNIDTAEVVSFALTSCGMDCQTYHKFSEALPAASGVTPCVVFADLHIPDDHMEIKEFVTAIRLLHPLVPIVLITADVRTQTLIGLPLTCRLVKPFDLEMVVSLAHSLCAGV